MLFGNTVQGVLKYFAKAKGQIYLLSLSLQFFTFNRFIRLTESVVMKTTILAVLGLLLILALKLEVEAGCETNGCSIPGNLPFPYKRYFIRACNKDDVCYACVRLSSVLCYKKVLLFNKMTYKA